MGKMCFEYNEYTTNRRGIVCFKNLLTKRSAEVREFGHNHANAMANIFFNANLMSLAKYRPFHFCWLSTYSWISHGVCSTNGVRAVMLTDGVMKFPFGESFTFGDAINVRPFSLDDRPFRTLLLVFLCEADFFRMQRQGNNSR